MRHGTRAKYVSDRCRCDECRRANADYQWAVNRRRKRALAVGATTAEHGQSSTYSNYGCRCDECRAAKRDQWATYSARQKAADQ